MNFESSLGKQEKPPVLYHGSVVFDIEELKPNIRHTPDNKQTPRIFAGKFPAWAVAHSWNWSSYEATGHISLKVVGEKITFSFPKGFDKTRLNVPVCIYKVSSDSFNRTTSEGTGETYDSLVPVRPISFEKFNSVVEAIKRFDGEIIFND